MEKTKQQENNTPMIIQVVKKLISKLQQNPDIYPIRYYKKSRRFRRHGQGPLVK